MNKRNSFDGSDRRPLLFFFCLVFNFKTYWSPANANLGFSKPCSIKLNAFSLKTLIFANCLRRPVVYDEDDCSFLKNNASIMNSCDPLFVYD